MKKRAMPFNTKKLVVMGGLGAALAYILWKRFWRKGYDDPIFITEREDGTKQQPILVITIGAPGSGKTTWAVATYGSEATIAADQWFDLFNNGQFDVTRLGEAHGWCFNQVLDRLQQGQDVVVNNTNTTTKEMFKYVAAVVFGGFPHKVVFATMPETNPKVLNERNLHGVPVKAIRNMLKNIGKMERKGVTIENVIRGGPMYGRSNGKPDKEVMFSGIWLDEESKERAHGYLQEQTGCALLSNVMDGHLTLGFSQPSSFVQQVAPYLGKEVELKVTKVAAHQWVQALAVDIRDPVLRSLCVNECPHITQAIDGPAKAVCSNALLEFSNAAEVDGPILKGRVGFFLKDRNADPKIVFQDKVEPPPEPEEVAVSAESTLPADLGASYVEVAKGEPVVDGEQPCSLMSTPLKSTEVRNDPEVVEPETAEGSDKVAG